MTCASSPLKQPIMHRYMINRRTGEDALPAVSSMPKLRRSSSAAVAIASANAAAKLAVAAMDCHSPEQSVMTTSGKLPSGQCLGQLGGSLVKLFTTDSEELTRPASSPAKLGSKPHKSRWSEEAELSDSCDTPPSGFARAIERKSVSQVHTSRSRRQLVFNEASAHKTGAVGLAECRTAVRLGRVADERSWMVPRTKTVLPGFDVRDSRQLRAK